MPDAERSAFAPSAATLHLDQRVMTYLMGRATLDEVVGLCVETLGPRPALTISLAHADAAVQERLRALNAALAEVRARAGS